MYSDNRWNEATAGRVYTGEKLEPAFYPKVKQPVIILVNVSEPFSSPLVIEPSTVRESNPKAASKQGDSPLVKPSAYKANNGSLGCS